MARVSYFATDRGYVVEVVGDDEFMPELIEDHRVSDSGTSHMLQAAIAKGKAMELAAKHGVIAEAISYDHEGERTERFLFT